ncbi:hypothetical protein QQ045_027630 [Rhodiola kirilowii]
MTQGLPRDKGAVTGPSHGDDKTRSRDSSGVTGPARVHKFCSFGIRYPDDSCYTYVGIWVMCRLICRNYTDGCNNNTRMYERVSRATRVSRNDRKHRLHALGVDELHDSLARVTLTALWNLPKDSSLVKSIPNPQTEAEKLYTTKHESYRKDVERCFGILQSQWAILRHSACIILHNMIVEEEFMMEEFVEVVEQDPHNPTSAFTVYDGPTDHNDNRIRHDPVGRAQRSEAFDERLTSLQSAYLHRQLQSDLVKHNWFIETGERL